MITLQINLTKLTWALAQGFLNYNTRFLLDVQYVGIFIFPAYLTFSIV